MRRKCLGKRGPAPKRTPQQSVERRAGPRHGPVISGDPEIDPVARRVIAVRRSAPAPVGALLPSLLSGSGERTGAAAGALLKIGRRSVGCLTIE